MSKKSANELDLTFRTPQMVGREKEIERLQDFLRARGERHFVYYWAHGGLGKTRLLEELQRVVAEAGPGFHSTGIIDLYHTDTHSSSDVERAIITGLDPDGKEFTRYRRERAMFELLRERGTDPGVLERHRETLSELFIKDCREMALDARKLVICFDTIELLQYESSVVEERAGSGTVDTRIRTWLLDKLAHLANVLIVFAGRPKPRSYEETIDHQNRLIQDMTTAFAENLTVIELEPFTLPEARDFIKVLTKGEDIIPVEYLPIVHRLTGGRPIFLHLIVDLVQVLTLELSRVLSLFDQYKDLVDVGEDDERLTEARHQIEVEILRAFINEGGERGEYLRRIALIPKGVDEEILQQALGLPPGEAEQLLTDLAPLSFVKRFKAPAGAERLHRERTFLHDEMYRLLTKPKVMPRLRINERAVAHALVANYYAPQINKLEERIKQSSPEDRIALRERLQKLQVERLYYLLVQDPCLGYGEYKHLSEQANRRRWVGFSMRLLDEFLRYYNALERRQLCERSNISHEQVIRESAQMWVERFYWWRQLFRSDEFARRILDQPDIFHIRPEEDTAILGNVCARWTLTRALLNGYEPGVVEEAQTILNRLPSLTNCEPEQALARARLSNAIGYQLSLGGLLTRAAERLVESKAAYETLKGYEHELALVLNNLAFKYAQQGRMILARPLAHEALRLNEAMGDEYSTGLTLSTLAVIAGRRGNYSQAIEYGQEALVLFRELEDAHGTALAYWSIVFARRRMAKHDFQKGRKLAEAYRKLQEAHESLQKALVVAEEAELSSDLRALRAEQGRVYRELGTIAGQLEEPEEKLAYYRQGEQQLKQALEMTGWPVVEQADTWQDLAEILFLSGDPPVAQQYLTQVEALIGEKYQIIPGKQIPGEELAREYFTPLGKVEMLRGQMAFAQEQFERGLQHFLLAYAYFMWFSPDAVEKENMVEYLYNLLRDVERKHEVVEAVRLWASQHDLGVDINSFMQILEDLLGV